MRAASPLATRGLVLLPFDLSLPDWPARAHRAGLTTIGLHAARRLDVLRRTMHSAAGEAFLATCRELGIQVEYELHAMGDLLSREYAALDLTLFRMDREGRRNPDANCCPSSAAALGLIRETAVEVAQALRPTTGRYFYWPDDGKDWCHCPACRELSATEQALLVTNAIAGALRETQPDAQVAHLAYLDTLPPPRQVAPAPGVFLEFAPYRRRLDQPLAAQTEPDHLALLDANLEVFDRGTAQALEYWLDVSLATRYRRPADALPWYPEVVAADVAEYRRRGVRHVTSFACYLDAEYVRRHGDPTFVQEYGDALARA